MRTNICAESAAPIFKKNLFNFEGISLGSRLTLKIGCFMTQNVDENMNMQQLTVSNPYHLIF